MKKFAIVLIMIILVSSLVLGINSPCESYLDCPVGEVCDTNNQICVECLEDSECLFGSCSDGLCNVYCNDNNDCPNFQECTFGVCGIPCYNHEACPVSYLCNYDYGAEPGYCGLYCTDNQDCGILGYTCQEFSCQLDSTYCSVDNDCDTNENCVNDFCKSSCLINEDCPVGKVCDNNYCSDFCTDHSDCAAGMYCKGGNTCDHRDCLSGNDCFDNFICNDFLGISKCKFVFEICDNSIDDDGDGFTDCTDPDCSCTQIWGGPDCENYCCNGQIRDDVTPPYQCEYNEELTCDNGLDDDWDSFTDCADSDCDGQSCAENKICQDNQCIIAIENCQNRFNNDNDGFIQCADPDCFGEQYIVNPDVEYGYPFHYGTCTYGTEEIGSMCLDHFDNDGDGLIDCADESCWGSGYCSDDGTENICNDGIDNDGDCGGINDYGFNVNLDCNSFDDNVDCLDSDCACTQTAGGPDCSKPCCGGETRNDAGYPEYQCEFNQELTCDNGVDDDGDGLIDCADNEDCNQKICGDNFICVDSQCIEGDVCNVINCPSDTECVGGKCVDNCFSCGSDKDCVDNLCQTTPGCIDEALPKLCPTGQICSDGNCVLNNCYLSSCEVNEDCLFGKCLSSPLIFAIEGNYVIDSYGYLLGDFNRDNQLNQDDNQWYKENNFFSSWMGSNELQDLNRLLYHINYNWELADGE